jgi:large conductance mechanosensitive channel
MDVQAIIKDTASEFKTFILKGNVVDLAVGIVVGAAFTKVVEAVVGSLVNPMISFISEHTFIKIQLADHKGFGDFVNAVLTLLIVGAVVFFFIVKPMNLLKTLTTKKAEEKPAEAPPIPEDIKLLIEIRDLLKEQKQGDLNR